MEIEIADTWYQQRSADAAFEFVTELSDALQDIRQAPDRWPQYLHGTRRYVLNRFPFSIIYLDSPESVMIIAVAHSKRKPGYWKRHL